MTDSLVTNVLAALENRRQRRATYHPTLPERDPERIKEEKYELTKLLDDYSVAVLQALVLKLADPTVTKIYLSELPYLKEFFGIPRDFAVLDQLRKWIYSRFGKRLRVEGTFMGLVIILP